MQFQVYTAGTNETRKLLGQFADYDSAHALFASHAAQLLRPEDGGPWAIVPVGNRDELSTVGNLESINPRYSGGCYILNAGGGVSCLGFAVAERKRLAVCDWLAAMGQAAPAMQSAPGTPAAFAGYLAAMDAGREYHAKTGNRCPAELTPELVGLEGRRVKVTRDDGGTHSFIVGKSTGWLPCHLEIESERARGGPAAYIGGGWKVEPV